MRADVPFYIVQLEFRLCRLAIPDIASLFCSVAHAKDLNLVQGKLFELAVHGKFMRAELNPWNRPKFGINTCTDHFERH
jgi:hypothetical protein